MLNPLILFSLSKPERYDVLRQWYSQLFFRWYDPLTYFSIWNIIIYTFITLFLDEVPIFYKLKMNVLYQTFLGGLYITYIYPKNIKVQYLNIILTDWLLYTVDFFSHQLLFFHSLFYYKESISLSWSEFIIINIPIFLYIRFFPVFYKYNIEEHNLVHLCFIYLFTLYFFT